MNLPVLLSTSTESYRGRDTETYRTTYSVEHLTLWRQAAPSILCIRECEHCVVEGLGIERLGIGMLTGADLPTRYVKLCILSLVFFTIYFVILTKSSFMRTGTSWNKTHDDEQRQHAINGVPSGIPGSVEVRMYQYEYIHTPI